jgi:hypothetical protein
VARISELRGHGKSLNAIACQMRQEGHRTSTGGLNWFGSTVAAVLSRQLKLAA